MFLFHFNNGHCQIFYQLLRPVFWSIILEYITKLKLQFVYEPILSKKKNRKKFPKMDNCASGWLITHYCEICRKYWKRTLLQKPTWDLSNCPVCSVATEAITVSDKVNGKNSFLMNRDEKLFPLCFRLSQFLADTTNDKMNSPNSM